MKITKQQAALLLPLTNNIAIEKNNKQLLLPYNEVGLMVKNATVILFEVFGRYPQLIIKTPNLELVTVIVKGNELLQIHYQKDDATDEVKELLVQHFTNYVYFVLSELLPMKKHIIKQAEIKLTQCWQFEIMELLYLHCVCNNHTGKFMLKVQKGAHELPSRWVDDDISLADFQNEMRDFFHDVLSEPMHELLK